jgi:hypothetical protein
MWCLAGGIGKGLYCRCSAMCQCILGVGSAAVLTADGANDGLERLSCREASDLLVGPLECVVVWVLNALI